jgi:CRP-like cAMP-binding protein
VIHEGAESEFFYFVKSGRLEVSQKTKSGQVAKLSIIGSGIGFGETALLTCSNCASTVRAITPISLYQLPRTEFENIIQHETTFKNMLLRKAQEYSQYNKIKTLQPFALLEPDKMYALMARMTQRSYALGEDIIAQGEKGDYYYIIKSGTVAVLQKKKGNNEAKQVALLREGDAFGEEALIRDDPRNATCRAYEDTVVYTLDKADFDLTLRASYLDNIFTEEIALEGYKDKYVIIDARVPAEYEEEHIEGALSIPTEVLRERYTSLDPRKAYITYCTNDARGMVAAFLLKNHGLKAKCLRGGISSWEGPTAKGPQEFIERRFQGDRRATDRRKQLRRA